ncbi:hypothetical protein BT96DRAFT_990918 [Gymnopus androsaceus JB14]|uniref:DUF6534 domain-containing protein n=1 Tax=Gymnopus androsaceus JB14 TaxID=1447944 RepID=A0A6A4HY74_9AGAR|nr:hypothetical protein BT96DRAFT_990918 [Gymnopus androsaceus JB14]
MLATAIVIMSIIEIGDLSNSTCSVGIQGRGRPVRLYHGHAFYCWRIRILRGSWWIIAAIMTLSGCSMCHGGDIWDWKRIMDIAINNGMITAIATCIELLFFLILPNSFVHFVLFYAIPKLYANCFMANLNSRPTVAGEDFEKSRFGWDASLQRGSLDDDSESKSQV